MCEVSGYVSDAVNTDVLINVCDSNCQSLPVIAASVISHNRYCSLPNCLC